MGYSDAPTVDNRSTKYFRSEEYCQRFRGRVTNLREAVKQNLKQKPMTNKYELLLNNLNIIRNTVCTGVIPDSGIKHLTIDESKLTDHEKDLLDVAGSLFRELIRISETIQKNRTPKV